MKKRQRILGTILFGLFLTFTFSLPSEAATLNKRNVVLNPYLNKTITLKVKKNKKKVSWSSSNNSIVTVDKKGVVTAKKAGTATIYAKRKNCPVLKCKVTVVNKGGLRYYKNDRKTSSYTGNGVRVRLYQGRYNGDGGTATFYAAHVQLSNYNKMYLAKANGKRSNGFQTISQMVKSKNTKAYRAILAVNGPFNGGDDRKWIYTGKWNGVKDHDYYEIAGGKYYEGKIGSDMVEDCATYSCKTGVLAPGTKQKGVVSGMSLADAAGKNLISDTFGGDMGFPVLNDGKVLGCSDKEGLRQRTFIGTNGKAGDFWIVVCNGQSSSGNMADKSSKGLNTYGEGQVLKHLGCNYGYNLDGGGSSTMIWKGKRVNKQFFDRPCYDALCIKR